MTYSGTKVGGGQLSGALEGYRVLEFGDYVASQMLGMLLADQGAEVVKVEPSSGARLRCSPSFAVWNRGKKSVVLEAESDRGRSPVESLAASADILISEGEFLQHGIETSRNKGGESGDHNRNSSVLRA